MHHTKTIITTPLKTDLEQLNSYQRSGDFAKANALCQKLLQSHPKNPTVLYCAGGLAMQQKQPTLALEYLTEGVKFNKHDPLFHQRLGHVLSELSKVDEAIGSYEQALKIKPRWGEVHCNLAIAFSKKADYAKAEVHARKAIQYSSNHPSLHNILANILLLQERVEEAINHYEIALSLNPNYDACYYNLATAYRSKARYKKAFFYYDKAIELNPKHLGAHHYSAILAYKLQDFEKAFKHFKMASELDPKNQIYLNDIGNLYSKFKDYPKAIEHFELSLQKFPKNGALVDGLLSVSREICDWDKQEYWTSYLMDLKTELMPQNIPFYSGDYIYLKISAEDKLDLAKLHTQYLYNKNEELLKNFHFDFEAKDKPILRIGYVSADICNHPVSHLVKNMFGYHNRKRFEVFLYSIGPNKENEYRPHIAKLCDHFIDMYENSSKEIIQRVQQDKIDILIDLMGYTGASRSEIFAAKPAPIQINYLGFPGTMGANFMDYIIADKTSIPLEHQKNYSEKVIYMPHTYFVTDNEQSISEDFKRSDFGLPEQAFVYACFNRSNKIDSEVFQSWMRILHQTSHSCLWMINSDPTARENLFHGAQKAGIEKERIIFSDQIPKDKHLARIKLADLFLDCFIYSAHTTAVDALWAGLPLITLLGNTITSRATGGILNAMHLPELMTETKEGYEQLAIDFAQNPAKLRELREKIARNRLNSSLFNTKQYVSYFEQGLEKAWKIYLDGKAPEMIEI